MMPPDSANADWGKRLSGLIHDMWFSVDDLPLGQIQDNLVIPLRMKPKDPPCARLIIPNARVVRVVDTERIGLYDISHVLVQMPERVLTIIGNIPIRVDIAMDDPCEAYVES
ncbi:MAG: hypothetical protein KF757_10560 [Phycisphaeraceae bacterium]|nr:hypothetical protein [Phycisphaeraceae bacterium]MCW5764078.1 hypothetical protein [Phycisphaeraceae bacterium]